MADLEPAFGACRALSFDRDPRSDRVGLVTRRDRIRGLILTLGVTVGATLEMTNSRRHCWHPGRPPSLHLPPLPTVGRADSGYCLILQIKIQKLSMWKNNLQAALS